MHSHTARLPACSAVVGISAVRRALDNRAPTRRYARLRPTVAVLQNNAEWLIWRATGWLRPELAQFTAHVGWFGRCPRARVVRSPGRASGGGGTGSSLDFDGPLAAAQAGGADPLRFIVRVGDQRPRCPLTTAEFSVICWPSAVASSLGQRDKRFGWSERTCAPGRTRTCDRLLRRQLLYPAELQAPTGTLCTMQITCWTHLVIRVAGLRVAEC